MQNNQNLIICGQILCMYASIMCMFIDKNLDARDLLTLSDYIKQKRILLPTKYYCTYN